MSANLSSEREISKFFSLSGVNIRPEACQLIEHKLRKLNFYDHKRAYLDKFLKNLKERQVLGGFSLAENAQGGNGVMILDTDVAYQILASMPLSEADAYMEEEALKTSNMAYGSFKALKKEAQAREKEELKMEVQQAVVKKKNPLLQDKVYKSLLESVVVLEDFTQFPKLIVQNSQIFYSLTSKRSIFDVNIARQDYFNNRMALAEERIFSNTDVYIRPKLEDGIVDHVKDSLTRVYNISSIVGQSKPRWILGIINQKEDGEYYIEDARQQVRLSFTELVFVDPEVFVTECSVVLAYGIYHNEVFSPTHLKFPPLHAQKSMAFKLNEQDYFGAYTKKQLQMLGGKADLGSLLDQSGVVSHPASKARQEVKIQKDDCIVILSQIELDTPQTQKNLRKLLEGLEQIKPDIVVLMGDFVSLKIAEKAGFDQLKFYFESIGQIIREQNFICLREATHWIFVPSVDDPGQPKLMPCL